MKTGETQMNREKRTEYINQILNHLYDAIQIIEMYCDEEHNEEHKEYMEEYYDTILAFTTEIEEHYNLI